MPIVEKDCAEGKVFYDSEWENPSLDYSGVIVNHEGRVTHFILNHPPSDDPILEEESFSTLDGEKMTRTVNDVFTARDGKPCLLRDFLGKWLLADPSQIRNRPSWAEILEEAQGQIDQRAAVIHREEAAHILLGESPVEEGVNRAIRRTQDEQEQLVDRAFLESARASADSRHAEILSCLPSGLLPSLIEYEKMRRSAYRNDPNQKGHAP